MRSKSLAYLFEPFVSRGVASEVKNSNKIALILLVAAAVLIPTVAVLHAVDTSTSSVNNTSHDDDHDQNHQEHDDTETSDDNSVTHADIEDANENAADTD